MKRQVLALVGAVALAAPLIGTIPAQAVTPRAGEPDQPTITRVVPGDLADSVLVDWAAPQGADGKPDTSVTNYQIRYALQNSSDWTTPKSWLDPAPTETLVSDLDPAKTYVFGVRALNSNGWGPWSADSAPVQPSQGVGAPINVTATAGEGLIDVSWKAPSPAAKAYEVQYRVDGTTKWLPDPNPLQTTSTFYRVDGLTAGVNYFFRVRSTNTSFDTSDWVVTDRAISPLGTPGTPTNVTALAGNGQATVYWSAPAPAPGSYQVQYRPATTTSWSPATPLTATGTSYTVAGLTNGTAYFFQVRSVRGNLTSDWVSTSGPVTPTAASTPSAPTAVSGIPQDSAIQLTWTMPSGQAVTNYEIQWSTNNANWIPTNPLSTGRTDQHYLLTGLTNGTAYYVRVRAVNGALASGWTSMPSAVIPLALPGPPLGLVGTPSNAAVTLNWIAPPVVGAMSPVVGYRVQYSTNAGATWASAPDVYNNVTTTTVTGLTNGVGYMFRVRAVSYAGDGAWSANSAIVTPPGGPGAPTSVTAVAGNAQATVAWNAPAGATGLIGYRVSAMPGGNSCTTSATPPQIPTTSCVVQGLANGVTYTFTVVAISNTGVSSPSAPSNAVTPVNPQPTASIKITQSGRNGSQVFARGTTTGLTSGTTLTALVRNKAGASFRPAGQVTVQDDGTFSWTTNSGKKTWIRFTSGSVTSNTVIVAAK